MNERTNSDSNTAGVEIGFCLVLDRNFREHRIDDDEMAV